MRSTGLSPPHGSGGYPAGYQTLDYVINYTKITAREMGVLHFDSDKYILEMSVLLKEGVEALQRGYQNWRVVLP